MLDVVGLTEIAERLGVEPRTVQMWRYRSQRGQMRRPVPEPEATVSGQPAWRWSTIRDWAISTRRLAEE